MQKSKNCEVSLARVWSRKDFFPERVKNSMVTIPIFLHHLRKSPLC